jgi:glucose uptake protein GlcU
MAMIAIALSVFNYIQSLPLEVTQKGRMFIGYAAVLLLVHGFYSSVYDSSNRTKEKPELELVV